MSDSKLQQILSAMGIAGPVMDHNPIVMGMQFLNGSRDDVPAKRFAEILKPFIWGTTPNKKLIATAYVIAQNYVMQNFGGPDLSNKPGTQRQRWYFKKAGLDCAGFKYFAQEFEQYLIKTADVVFVDSDNEDKAKSMGAKQIADKRHKGKVLRSIPGAKYHIWPKGSWQRVYDQLQSGVMVELVLSGEVAYKDMWITDNSRQFAQNSPLLSGVHIMLAVEKQGLFDFFRPFCRRAGIEILLAMGGICSFAATEKMAEKFMGYDWQTGKPRISPDNPLELLVMSDHDYSGHEPVQGGIVNQLAHYLGMENLRVTRVGVTPEQVIEAGHDPIDAGYEFDAERNKATQKWAKEHALWRDGVPYAIELEALLTKEYIPYLVQAVIDACGGDEALKEKLLAMAGPDWDQVAAKIADEIAAATYLAKLSQKLVEISHAINQQVVDTASHLASLGVGDADTPESWAASDVAQDAITSALKDEAKNITAENFADHLGDDNGWGTWQPVTNQQATDAAVGAYLDQNSELVSFVGRWFDGANLELIDDLEDVLTTLECHA